MNTMLKIGQPVHTGSGKFGEVEQFLEGGTEAEVYCVKFGDTHLALKWYFPSVVQADSFLRNRLETIIRLQAPNPKFLWPIDLVSAEDVPAFGYIMPLRNPQYLTVIDLLKGRIAPSTHVLATIGLNLATYLQELHAQNMYYKSISLTSFFFDPLSGDVIMSDNDTLIKDNSPNYGISSQVDSIILSRVESNYYSDLDALAVLLFYMFHCNNPSYQKKLLDIHDPDVAAHTQMSELKSVLVNAFGMEDHTISSGSIYPQFLRSLFTRAFAHVKQMSEKDWQSGMALLRDSIFECARCQKENFFDIEVLRASGGKPWNCWSCKRALQLPMRIRIDNRIVTLNLGTKLFLYHIDPSQPYNLSNQIAEVVSHPTEPNIWGLKNLSNDLWQVTGTDLSVQKVMPGQSVRLYLVKKINFGQIEGEVRLQ